MSILAALSPKPIVLLTLSGAVWPIRSIGRLFSDAAEVRGRAVASCYLTAMGISDIYSGTARRTRHET